MVIHDKLILLNRSFFSGHSEAAVNKHFLMNSHVVIGHTGNSY
jgi:hypothetical protein